VIARGWLVLTAVFSALPRMLVRDDGVTKGMEVGRIFGQHSANPKPIADNKAAEGHAKNRKDKIKVN
jgi:hypothetical protein